MCVGWGGELLLYHSNAPPHPQIIMAAAAKNLTPCTLELGGKNPTFIHSSAKLELAARRILLAKTANAGQWCVRLKLLLCYACPLFVFQSGCSDGCIERTRPAPLHRNDAHTTTRHSQFTTPTTPERINTHSHDLPRVPRLMCRCGILVLQLTCLLLTTYYTTGVSMRTTCSSTRA